DAVLHGKISWIIGAPEARLVVGVDGESRRGERVDVELPVDQRRAARRPAVNEQDGGAGAGFDVERLAAFDGQIRPGMVRQSKAPIVRLEVSRPIYLRTASARKRSPADERRRSEYPKDQYCRHRRSRREALCRLRRRARP